MKSDGAKDATTARASVREEVLEIIWMAVEDLNAERSANPIEKAEETPLIGPNSQLDSIGLVGLLVGLEMRLAERFGDLPAITSERALSQRSSPFRTMGTLADYVAEMVQESHGNA